MNQITVNKVFRRVNDTSGTDELIRIIWTNPDNRFIQYVSLSIDVAMPHPTKIADFTAAMDTGFIVEAEDPFARVFTEDQIPDRYKPVRDGKLRVASYVWEKNLERALQKKERPALFNEAARLFDVHPMDVRRTLSRFWQRGMTPNALLPDFDKRGQKGFEKSDTAIKRGRPREYLSIEDELPGINITTDVKEKIRAAIDLYYLSRRKPSIKDTYNQMLHQYFSDVTYLNGVKMCTIWGDDRIPSYHQFYYWLNKFVDTRKNLLTRDGEREFALKYRELLGDLSAESFGPGFKYQIDATIADVFLVSILNSDYIIGRPVVYAVIDVFSRLIVGMYVGVEGPSWVGAMMAIDNVVADKVEYCSQYGVEIQPEQWPSSLLSERLLADRGEFEGTCPEAMITNLGISIENTPPYRGDLKGIVERHFRTTNERIKSRLPGAVRKAIKVRGEPDYRMDAQLNMDEFTRIMILEVIKHNNSLLEQYSKSLLEISDNVKPIPAVIWKWGLENRRCGFMARDRDFVRLSLMPREKATVTRAGIRFHGIHYSCDLAIKEGWFVSTKRSSITIAYDPRRLENIYIPNKSGRGLTKCFPVANSKGFGSLSYDDYLIVQRYLAEEKASLKPAKRQLVIDTDEEIRKIVQQAKNRAKISNSNTISKAERLRNIKGNRAIERIAQRKDEGFELGASILKTNGQVIPIDKSSQLQENADGKKRKSQSDYEDEILDLLKKERDERLGRKH